MKFLYALLLLPMLAFGQGNDCDHPRFVEHGCEVGGADGADGADGQNGSNGADGTNGTNGTNGIDGIDGIDGRDGVVSQKWINETHNWQSKWLRYTAANEAIQIHLPQDQKSRVTFGISRVHGNSGYAIGYAYKYEDGLAFTLGLGTSGGEQVGKASVGFEFGGNSKTQFTASNYKAELECSYVNGVLSLENKCVINK